MGHDGFLSCMNDCDPLGGVIWLYRNVIVRPCRMSDAYTVSRDSSYIDRSYSTIPLIRDMLCSPLKPSLRNRDSSMRTGPCGWESRVSSACRKSSLSLRDIEVWSNASVVSLDTPMIGHEGSAGLLGDGSTAGGAIDKHPKGLWRYFGQGFGIRRRAWSERWG